MRKQRVKADEQLLLSFYPLSVSRGTPTGYTHTQSNPLENVLRHTQPWGISTVFLSGHSNNEDCLT